MPYGSRVENPSTTFGRRATRDRRADIFALGVLLHEMLFGFVPADGNLMLPPASAAIQSSLDREVSSVLRHCLQDDPELRFSSAESLAKELRRCLAEPGRRPAIHREEQPFAVRWLTIRDGLAHETEVDTGIETHDLVQILTGLSAGDVVATTGGYGLPDGCPVQIVTGISAAGTDG